MKILKLEVTDQAFEKLSMLHDEYLKDRRQTAEAYARNSNFDMANKLSENFSIEDFAVLIIAKFIEQKGSRK